MDYKVRLIIKKDAALSGNDDIIEWRRESPNSREGILHNENGPAFIYPRWKREWRLNGSLHRVDGPAIEFYCGSKKWYWHGKPHRENGPAVIINFGTQAWYKYGKLHRLDGPARIEHSYEGDFLGYRFFIDDEEYNLIDYIEHPLTKVKEEDIPEFVVNYIS